MLVILNSNLPRGPERHTSPHFDFITLLKSDLKEFEIYKSAFIMLLKRVLKGNGHKRRGLSAFKVLLKSILKVSYKSITFMKSQGSTFKILLEGFYENANEFYNTFMEIIKSIKKFVHFVSRRIRMLFIMNTLTTVDSKTTIENGMNKNGRQYS